MTLDSAGMDERQQASSAISHYSPRPVGRRRREAMPWEMVGYAGSIEAGPGRDISVARQAECGARWMHRVGLGRAAAVAHDLDGEARSEGGAVQRLLLTGPLEPRRRPTPYSARKDI